MILATLLGMVQDGSIIRFVGMAHQYFMKVCDRNGIGGVVNLRTGLYTPISKIGTDWGEKVFVVAESVSEFFLEKFQNQY